MIRYNTRFNPTVNGPLHLGHLYSVLINMHEAHRSGGTFTLRFDDTQRSWLYRVGHEKTQEYKQQILDDLKWLGIVPDKISHQSEMMDEAEDLLNLEFDYWPSMELYHCDPGAEVIGFLHHVYPYTDKLTSEKVVFDMLDGATWLIRGYDLLTEDNLYRHFCARFGVHPPRSTYIPRLLFRGGGIISKTEGNYKISQFWDAGMDPEAVLGLLAIDCLLIPDGGWYVDNIKAQPELGAWADKVLA